MEESGPLFECSRFRVVRLEETTRDGARHAREVIRHPGAVAILPLLDDGRICLIENHRAAVDRTLVELPAGTREPDEDPAETARRELIEETGYRAEHIRPLIDFYTSPGVMDERMYLFLATGLTPGPMDLAPGEQIEPLLCTWDEAMRMIRDGRIRDAKTIAGLLYYQALV